MADLNEAVKIQIEIVDSAPDTNILHPLYMSGLARSLGDRSWSFKRTTSPGTFRRKAALLRLVAAQAKEGLRKALGIARSVVDVRSDADPSRGMFLYTLENSLGIECDEGGNGDWLSIVRGGTRFMRRAIDHTPKESPNSEQYLNELGSCLYLLRTRSREEAYCTESIECFDSSVRHGNSSPRVLIAAGKSVLHVFRSSGDIEVAFEAQASQLA